MTTTSFRKVSGWFIGCVFTSCLVAAANADTTGWRGDGSGRFANAQPPTKWSKDSENILWKIDAGNSYSSPVLCEQRLFITDQPADVICINADIGKELWRQSADYKSVLGEAEADRIAQRRVKLESDKRKARKQYDELRKLDHNSPQLETLQLERKEFEDRKRDFERQFPAEKRGGAGNAAATVACDSEHVFALFGTGIIAAFTVEGERLWARQLEIPQQGFGHAASPVLAGGHLIVHIQQLTALDPETGETVWRTDVPAKFGTPAVANIDGKDVVITPSGALVVADDGQLLAEKQFKLSNNSPLVHNSVVYAHEGGNVKAFRLPSSLKVPFELEPLWETPGSRDQRMASAVFHDGMLYAVGRRGILDVTDAATGDLVYRKRLDIGEFFASPAMAGGLIFYASRNGQTLVLRPGPEYDEVAVNTSERVSATRPFAQRRMYLRTDRSLMCIGE